MEFKEENKVLFNNFFDDFLFKRWKGEKNSWEPTLEIQLTPKCNLSCEYCYIENHGEKLFPGEIKNSDIINNLKYLLEYLYKEKAIPEKISIFSGDPLTQEIGFEALDILYKKFKEKEEKPKLISIPTNYTFIFDDELVDKVEKYINKFKEIGIRLILSSSFDGKILEEFRPLTSEKNFLVDKEKRDEEYYNKIFKFNKKHGFGYHPMIYSKGVKKWEENFKWFQNKFKKYDINWKNLYLLEVRNANWSDEQINDFYDFIKFLLKWSFEKVGYSKEKMIDFILDDNGFAILSSPFKIMNNRGIGCTLQTAVFVRLHDFKLVPCHRIGYEGNEYGKFIVEEEEIKGIEPINIGETITNYTFGRQSMPICSSCTIKDICIKGCLGSQLETNKDPYTPIPTVCKLEHSKIFSLIEGMEEIGIFEDILSDARVKEEQKEAFLKMKKIKRGDNNE